MLLKSLVIIGAILGLLLGIVGTSVPWLFPKIFTHDQNVIQEVSSCFLSSSVMMSNINPFISFRTFLLFA
jgi:hypothetical protein